MNTAGVAYMGNVLAIEAEAKFETKGTRDIQARIAYLRHSGQFRGSAGSRDGLGLSWSSSCGTSRPSCVLSRVCAILLLADTPHE